MPCPHLGFGCLTWNSKVSGHNGLKPKPVTSGSQSLGFSLTEQFPAWLTKVYSVGRGRRDSRQVHPGPPHLTCQPQLCQLPSALPKPRGSDILPIWFLGKDEDKGRDSVMLVHPAVSRWQEEAIPTVSHTYLCLSPSSVPKENLNRAVNVAGSAEGYRFREAGCRLAWLRTF